MKESTHVKKAEILEWFKIVYLEAIKLHHEAGRLPAYSKIMALKAVKSLPPDRPQDKMLFLDCFIEFKGGLK